MGSYPVEIEPQLGGVGACLQDGGCLQDPEVCQESIHSLQSWKRLRWTLHRCGSLLDPYGKATAKVASDAVEDTGHAGV